MTRRERNLARLNEARLKEVFQVLVRNCGASADEEEQFLYDLGYRLERFSSVQNRWRFEGYFDGLGLYFGEDGLPSLCAPVGDLDVEGRSMLVGISKLFYAMADRWRDEDRLSRARARREATRREREAERASRGPRERLSAIAG